MKIYQIFVILFVLEINSQIGYNNNEFRRLIDTKNIKDIHRTCNSHINLNKLIKIIKKITP